ncbi:hypothetical protein BDZ89DRAFT_917517, partial [Hymenopellis radicata]
QSSIEPFARGSTYSDGRLRYHLVELVCLCQCPFAIAEYNPMRSIVTMNNAKARVFSTNTLSKDVKEAYEVTKDDVPGRLHMVFDGWASGGKRSSQGL